MGPISYTCNMFANDMTFILDADIDIYNYADDNSLCVLVLIMKMLRENYLVL